MKPQNANVLVHIKEDLPQNTMKDIASSLKDINGVVQSDTTEKKHLLIVDYDSEITDSQPIIENVREKGVHAELVGL